MHSPNTYLNSGLVEANSSLFAKLEILPVRALQLVPTALVRVVGLLLQYSLSNQIDELASTIRN